MNPRDLYAANEPTGDAYDSVRIVAVDNANDAVIVAPANEFGENIAVERESLIRHYHLTAAAQAGGAWETVLS